MNRFRAAALTVVALLACVAFASARAPGARAGQRIVVSDSTVLARVGNRVIRVHDYRDRYFAADAESKPGPDSLGRIAFLKIMIDKEIMGLTAQARNRPLSPSDQLTMKRHVANMLAFIAYKRNVQDPVVVTERELRERHETQSFELRLRYMLLPDEATARAVRSQLANGKTTWSQAATRYSLGPDSLRDGDLGWKGRYDMAGIPLAIVFALHPPGISDVTVDQDGFKIWQCLGRRPVQLAPYIALRRTLLQQLRAENEAVLEHEFMEVLTERAKPRYDSTNIVWLAERFRIANESLGQGTTGSIDMRSRTPVLGVEDTSRVLATTDKTRVTCGRLLTTYRDRSPLQRQRIQTPMAVFGMVQRMALEPAVVAYAMEQHVDRDPQFISEIAKYREGILVQHLYEDSVDTNIQVSEPMRRAYFAAHPRYFMNRERVSYAVVPRLTQAGADSVIAQFKSGETAQAILASDSLTGMNGGKVLELVESQPHTYYNLLFSELREGQSTKEYLSSDRLWVVFHIVSHTPGSQLSYADAREKVDEAVENEMAERVLKQFLTRQRKHIRIQSHPELLPSVQLTDPESDWNLPSGD